QIDAFARVASRLPESPKRYRQAQRVGDQSARDKTLDRHTQIVTLGLEVVEPPLFAADASLFAGKGAISEVRRVAIGDIVDLRGGERFTRERVDGAQHDKTLVTRP